ncbi:MAG: S8 family serine peptidase [Alphaproteobacteria bacterium]|nr:S8 family serine peptidase [Alphaproteobacteria bacterium]
MSALWGKNHVHDPSYIFEPHPSGSYAVNPRRATNAAFLHLDEVKGRLKNGTPLKAAIIDSSFNPNYTKLLADEGVIHPDALQPGNPYCLAPNENFNESTIYNDRNNELILQKWFSGSQKERNRIQRQIDQLQPLLDAENKKNEILRVRKCWYDLFTIKDAGTHGSGVMEALHFVAPKVQLLPIDTLVFDNDLYLNASQKLTKAIRAAIAHQVNVINMSFSLSSLNQEGMEAIADAVRQGIAIFIAAGNDSSQGFIHRIHDMWDKVKGMFVKSNEQKLFERVQGKGILFAGALGYHRNGEEEVASFSQLPDASTKRRFLLAPGVDIPVHAKCDSSKLVNGTSFSSPIIAGGYLLLLQHALDNGYPYGSSEFLLDILQDSGKKVIYERWWPFSDEEYKSIDLYAAQKLLDRKFKHVVSKPVPQKPVVSKSVLQKPAVSKPVLKPAVRKGTPKKPFVRKTFSKKPVVNKPVKSAVRKGTPKKLVVRKTFSKKPVVSKPVLKPAVRKGTPKKPVVRKTVSKKPTVRKFSLKKSSKSRHFRRGQV